MNHLTTTPFGPRPISACLIENYENAQQAPALPHVDKWEIFRELTVAKARYGLTDRDLAVLNALLSFHPSQRLCDNEMLIVFPSNRSLCARAHGMAESTLRRHVAALVRSGLILRHDSPNGKRYASKDADGEVTLAFGFDLRPLLVLAREISAAAEDIREETAELQKLRTALVLKLRDARKLLEYGQAEFPQYDWSEEEGALAGLRNIMRRKLVKEVLRAAFDDVDSALSLIRSRLLSEKTVGNDNQYERHLTNSKTDSLEFEPCCETANGQNSDTQKQAPEPVACPIPLQVVVKACPDLEMFGQRDIRSWYDLISSAAKVRASMGISPSAWQDAQKHMGEENAAVTVAAMLQRMSKINNPGGYLRALTRKAADQKFSPGPMVMALLTSES